MLSCFGNKATLPSNIQQECKATFLRFGGALVRGHHLGTVERTDWCTLQVRVGAPIDMLGRGRAVRGRESATESQKSSFALLLNVL